MNRKHHRTIYNRVRGCLMAVAETAKSSGKAGGESRSGSMQTRRKARFTWSLQSLGVAIALSLQAALVLPSSYAASASQSQQGLQASDYSTSINSALTRSSYEGYAASQLGSGDEALRCALLHFATCTRPHLFTASQAPVVTQNDPSVNTAGGNITLTGTTITNQQSKIIAGGALNAVGATINNTQILDQRRVNDVGTQWSWGVVGGHDDCWPCHWVQDWGMVPSTYNVDTFTSLPVSGGVTQTATSPTSAAGQLLSTTFVGTTVANALSLGSRPAGSLIAAIPTTQNPLLSAFANGQTAAATQTASGAAFAKTTNTNFTQTTPAITVPNNSLFRTPTSINATYLIETDPRFANYKTWLSSDYLLTALSFDPVLTQKRLGDGFYEQRLIREQVATLTGQRFLAGYQSEEEEYRALMDNAVTVAKSFNLRPGIALSEEQVAQLTSDIVWLVEKDVLLPNGTTVKALVPQVYAKLRNGDLQADGKLLGGSLLSGNSVNLEASGNITNGGTILGRKLVSLTADNINNSNAILGSTVALTSKTDINNTGGNITAKDALLVDAGRDLNVVTNTNTTTAGVRTATTLDRVAGLYVTSPTGILVANAGNNINLTAAQIQSAGSAQLQAGGNVNLGAASVSESLKFEFGVDDKGRNLGRQYINQSTQTGTSIQTGGNLNLSANQNIQGTAATIQAGGTANLNAGGNIALVEGRTTKSEDLNWLETRKDLTSSTTKRTSASSDQSTAITTTISGASGVDMQAQGGTLLLSGANVSSTGGNIALSGTEVIIASTQNGQNNTRTIDEKKTGASLSDLAGIATFGVLAPIANAGRGINATSKDNAMAGDTSLVQTTVSGQNVQVTSTAGNISLKAAALNATGTGSAAGTVNLDAGTNAVNLQTLQTSNYQSTSKETSDVLWQTAKGSGSQNQNTNYNQINGNLSVTAAKVNVEIVQGSKAVPASDGLQATLGVASKMTPQEAAQTLASQPGMGYLNQLANDPALKDKINWQKVDEAHKNWNYDQQGLSPTGAAIVSLAVAYATGGAGGGIVSAGMSTLASQASVALINNGGDIGKTLEQMGNSQSLRGIAMSMVTAGVLQGLPNLLPADMQSVMGATAKSGFTDLLAKNLTNSLATAVVSSAINGSSLEEALKQNVISAIINTGMAKTANAIGDAASNKNETIKLNEFGRSVAHAIAGCVAGAAKANSGDGCSAGAVGAVVGELAAQFYNDGTGIPKTDTVQFAALMSGIAGAVVGGDARSVNLAAATGGNAAANNYLNHAELARKQALDKKAASGETLTTQEQKDRNDLNVASINRNTVIRDGALVVTPEQGNAILKDMQGTMVGLVDYKSNLENQLQNASDPTQRAQLQTQINEADNNIRQIATLGKDYNAALYQKTGDIKYQTAFQQLTSATSGNEFADALMMGTAATGQRTTSTSASTRPADTSPSTNSNANNNVKTTPSNTADAGGGGSKPPVTTEPPAQPPTPPNTPDFSQKPTQGTGYKDPTMTDSSGNTIPAAVPTGTSPLNQATPITSNGTANIATGSKLADDLAADMSKPIVTDPNLARVINQQYRPNATVGTGSTADAVRHELATGEPVGGRTHIQKAQNDSVFLQDWLEKNPNASFADRSAAQNVLRDLQNALRGN